MRWDGLEEAVAIADTGSFVRAARLLNVSTSHVSRVIARMEDTLGTTLFHRTTRRVGLTETGHSFVTQARRLIQERDELLAFAAGDGDPQGELRVTCSIAMGERFIAPILAAFADRHPRLSITLELTNRVTDIVGEGYDIGVRTGDAADRRLVAVPIANRRLETVASPRYIDERGAPTSVDALSHHDCLAGTASSWHFMEGGQPRLFVPKGRWRCNSGTVVAAAALDGRGICQLPEFYVRAGIGDGRLVRVLDHCQSEPEIIWMVYPERRHLLPKVRRLADELQDKLQAALDAP